MAIYQFTVELIPNGTNPIHSGRVDVERAWRNFEATATKVAETIDSVVPRAKPFANNMALWGDDTTDDLQLWQERDRVMSLTARFNCVEPSVTFFEHIAKIAATLGLSALIPESLQIIESPSAVQLANHALRSHAADAAAEPHVQEAYHGRQWLALTRYN